MTLKQPNQLYFTTSSSDEDVSIPQTMMLQSEPKPRRPRKKTYGEDNINELSGLQVFELFCNQKQLNALLNNDDVQNIVKIRFFWRIHYIIGEIILQVQQLLVQENKLLLCLPLKDAQIDRVAFKIISKAQKSSVELEFLKMKNHLQAIYKNSHFDLPTLIELYNTFVKESWVEFKFEMVVRQEKKSPSLPNPYELDTRRNLNYLPNNYNRTNLMSMSTVDAPVVRMTSGGPFNIQGYIQEENQGRGEQYVHPVDKGVSCKWTSVEQGVFCKIYSEQESPVVCVQLMEQKLGSDGRWRSASQIELKMYSLVQKVFKKFATLNTNNEYIKKFRSQKDLILNMPDPLIKKKIFRNIAIIYESMLNVSQEKKAVISQKILEVNRLCKDATLMNH